MNIFTMARARRALPVLLTTLLLGVSFAPVAAQDDPTATIEPSQPATTAPEATSEPATATPTPTAARPVDIRFGVIESYEDPAASGRLGVAWTRVRFQWADVQPTGPDEWVPPVDDEALDAEREAGREVVGLLIGIPDWARDRRGLPRGLALPPDDPDNLWAAFVAEAVTRYAGRIDRWIIWNEPDIDDPDAPGHTWDGTLDEFVQLQRVAYLATKAANPEAVVHLGAFTYFWDPGYFARFLDVVTADPAAAAHNYYFDVATAHLYFQPNAVYNVLYAFRQVMADHGLSQPIWLVETNAPPMNDPYWEVDNWTLAVTLNEQAAFIPQALAAAFAAGAERVAVYKLKDTAGDRAANPEPFGLLRWDDSRRPAFDTYRIAIRLMSGIRATERERWDAVAQVRLEQAGQSTTVLFARLPGSQEARVPATADEAEWVDMWGKRETIESRGGYFTVELPGALCTQTIADYCMIGGTTYYLVQADDYPIREATATRVPPTATRQPAPSTAEPSSPVATAMAEPLHTPATAPVPAHTVSPHPTVAAESATPAARPIVAPPAPANYSGLAVIGLGVVLGVVLVGWWLAGRRNSG